MLTPDNGEAWLGRAIAIADGDTLTIEPIDGGMPRKIRLYGIDAPERRQPGGEAARGVVLDSALYQLVNVEPVGKPDRYKRTVAIVYLPSGVSLQVQLLQAGLAWVWPRYCRNCEAWQALQDAARRSGRGLWADPDPVSPWEWRRQKR